MTDFRHPGGNFLLDQLKGREIGRYIYGIYNLETISMNPHYHTIFALNHLQTRLIGTLKGQEVLIFNESSSEKHWMVTETVKLSETTSLFKFRSNVATVKNALEGIGWLGKHFVVNCKENPNFKRLYTTVLCYTAENISYREKLLGLWYKNREGMENDKENEYFERRTNSLLSAGSVKWKIEDKESFLPLIVKNYNEKKGFSWFLHNNTSKVFEIEGHYVIS